MGMWGWGTFENDDAQDWASEFARAPSRRALSKAFDRSRRAAYIEVDQAAASLAAAEVMTAMLGKPSPALPSELATWAAANPLQPTVPEFELCAEAVDAIRRIEEGSEMKELVEESGGIEEWTRVIEELLERFQAVTDLTRRAR